MLTLFLVIAAVAYILSASDSKKTKQESIPVEEIDTIKESFIKGFISSYRYIRGMRESDEEVQKYAEKAYTTWINTK